MYKNRQKGKYSRVQSQARLAISKYPKPTLFLHPIVLVLLVLLDDRYLGVARTYRFVGTLARAPAQGRLFLKQTCDALAKRGQV
jgi:hypothetical protein